MKLKTKFQDEDFELGDTTDIDITTMPDGCFKVKARTMRGGLRTFYYNTKADFDAAFEDAPEEVKKVWFIDADGELGSCTQECEYDECGLNAVGMKSIDNYFESKEEAEKAVEKLKAFNRLKDKGFKFYGWRRNQTGTYELYLRWKDRIPRSYEIKNDLDLLFCFGGEE